MIKILFEDNHIIVAVKPYGLLSQSDITKEKDILTELKTYLKEKYKKPGNVFLGLVHRLDKNVGGVMVFAKTSKAAARLSKSIQSDKFKKRYLVIVNGIPKSNEMILKHYLLKSKEERRSIAYNHQVSDSKYAELSFKLIDKEGNFSLLEVVLKTGRPHQIRVQLSTIGLPIYGDKLYIDGIRESSLPICLWAFSLGFPHPVSGEILNFIEYPPKTSPWAIFNIP